MTDQIHDTPIILMMPTSFLEYLKEIVDTPENLNSAGVLKKATLIRMLQESVTADEYNNAIVKRVLAIQSEQRIIANKQEIPLVVEVVKVAEQTPEVEVFAPKAANVASNFKPHRLLLEEEAEEKAAKETKKRPKKSPKAPKKID
jgi:hypothetical protein